MKKEGICPICATVLFIAVKIKKVVPFMLPPQGGKKTPIFIDPVRIVTEICSLN